MAYDPTKLTKLAALEALALRVKENKEALAALEAAGGQANVLEGVKVNGTALTIAADKTVDVTVATGAADGTIAVNGTDVLVKGVDTLIGEDTGKSVRTIANEELAAKLIAEDASESLDTLEEIAAWIQSHPDDAAAMNKAITDLTALVGTLPEGVTSTDVVAYITEAIEARIASDEEVAEMLATVFGDAAAA